MNRKLNSLALVLVLTFAFTTAVFAAPLQEVQEGVYKDGVEYVPADELVKSTSGIKTGTKISANKSYNEIKLDGEVVGHFTFNKDASPLSITITKNVNVIVEWKCAKYYMTCELKNAGVYSLPQILQDNGKLKNFDQIWISFGAMLAPGTIINGAVPKTTTLMPVSSVEELAAAPGISLKISTTTGLLTEYAARDAENGATAKIMKYPAGEANFADKEEWNNTIPVETGDIFVIKVTAANGVTTNYYKIIATTYDATLYYTARGFNIPGLTFQPTTPDTNGIRFEPTEVFKKVYFIGDSWICAMLWDTGDGIVMWDALETTDDMINILEPDMKKLGLNPADIKTVFVSHGHGDHYGGAKYLQDTYGAKVYMHEDDMPLLAGRPGIPNIDEYYKTHVQTDGSVTLDQVTQGNATFTFMHTPGHTPGSTSFFVPVTDFNGIPHILTCWGGTSAPTTVDGIQTYTNSVTRYREYIKNNGVDAFLSMHPFVDYSTDNVAAVRETGSSDALIRTPEQMDLFCWSLRAYTQLKRNANLTFANSTSGFNSEVLSWPFLTYIPESNDTPTLEAAWKDLNGGTYLDDIIAAQIFDNVYLVGTGKDACLIFDTGAGIVIVDAMTSVADFTDIVLPKMGSFGLQPSDIKAVMITHGHADKYGFASYLRDTYGAKIYMNNLDAVSGGPVVDFNLGEGSYTFGVFTFDWYHTPGHTPGTMSFLVDVTVDGEPHTAALWGGTTFVYEKAALTDYADSIERFLEISVDSGADAIVSTHPYFDFAVQKAEAIAKGYKKAFILGGDTPVGGANTPVGGDNTLEFLLTCVKVTAEHKLQSF